MHKELTRAEHKALSLQERLIRIKKNVLNGMPITKACDEERLTWRTFVQYEYLFTDENKAVMTELKTHIKDRSNRHGQSKDKQNKALQEILNGETIGNACRNNNVSLQAFRDNVGGSKGIAEKYNVKATYTGVPLTEEEITKRIYNYKESMRNGKSKTESYRINKIAAIKNRLSKQDIEEIKELQKRYKHKRTKVLVGEGR
jgi:hypothetical protein